MKKAKSFSLSAYIEQALRMAEYEKDENGVVVASVPNVAVFFLKVKILKKPAIIFETLSKGIFW